MIKHICHNGKRFVIIEKIYDIRKRFVIIKKICENNENENENVNDTQ